MTKLRKVAVWCLIFIVEALSVAAPGLATAQTAIASNAATAAINAIIQGAGTFSSGSVGATANSIIANAAGRTAPIVGSAVTGMTAARLAGLATSAIKVGTFVGIATLVIPWIYDQSGYKVCPPPQFFCKDKNDYDPAVGGFNVTSTYPGNPFVGTANDVMSQCIAVNNHNNNVTDWANGGLAFSTDGKTVTATVSRLNSQHTVITNTCAATRSAAATPPPTVIQVGVPDADVTTSITSNINATPSKQKQVYDTLQSDKVPNIHSLTDPVTVTAPPVTFPSIVTTEQVGNADGSTSTKVTTQTTVVNPVQTGTTLGDAGLNLPQTTTTTVKLTNNTTGASTTTTATQTDTAGPSSPPLQFPTDYNRELTQQSIQTELKAAAAPTLPPQGPVVSAATSKSDADLAAQRSSVQDQHVTDKSGFFAWVWTPPVGTCAASSGTVHTYSVSWDICPTVSNIRDVLGWMLAVFGMVSVYSELFKKGEE